MKKLFYTENRIENKISYYHLLFFLLTLPFDRFYSTVILVSFLIHTLIYFKKEKIKDISYTMIILQSVFIVTILSACYARSFPAALNVVTKQLAILLFPVLFTFTSLDIGKYRSRLLEIFAIGCTCTVLYLFCDALHVIWYNKLPFNALFSQSFVNHNFSLPIELHATYFSMFLLMSVVYCFHRVLTESVTGRRIFFTVCIFILAAGLIQLSSKSVFIALFIIINIGFPWFLFKQKAAIRFLLVSLSVSALLMVLILSVNVFRERLLIDFKNDLFKGPVGEKLSWRIYRWDAAVDLIKQSPVVGHGAGSEIPLLKASYFDRKMYAAYLSSLNVHNQYLSFLINAGIIGLLIYISTLCWGFWQAIKLKDILLLSFMVLTTVISFSEDILDVNKGIFFYAFFFSFLTISNKEQFT